MEDNTDSSFEKVLGEINHDDYVSSLNRRPGIFSNSIGIKDPTKMGEEYAAQWVENGYIILRGFYSDDECKRITEGSIDAAKKIVETGVEVRPSYFYKKGSYTVPEENFEAKVDSFENGLSKIYNLHREDVHSNDIFQKFCQNKSLNKIISGILGDNVDCFNSQFIFKNPGALGQPWHQDSLYYNFDRAPQVGVWLATSKATEENGCLFVSPGSHKEAIHYHEKDPRQSANLGYVEICDYDFSNEIAVTMDVGDVLIFHSLLMHKSIDNSSDNRRSAMVFHFADRDTKFVGPTIDEELMRFWWVPTVRDGEVVCGLGL
ncbi:phytanoyl-CoA dioxygenase family protein [Zhongshania sp.]|jgi:ectoine hydroxylase-related dioxygenase (phytanoyl-CoA dioxygenase family)|uniref:phytanoyl-CoA dioxygenase family protein n=1 Tax=Zhongshania sp. TaxID=1971902 RepID=UPI002A811FCC|nr:phytanoyl-CoA dioxygenase family protein [Zhongshania sp.]